MRTRFIINPKAGTGKVRRAADAISTMISAGMHDWEISYTKSRGDAGSIALDAVKHNYDSVIAVGGDGSVNEAAAALTGTPVKLGIIPCGSGNGIARHFGIPQNIKGALKLIMSSRSILIDTCIVNNRRFIMLAGVGFDAFIAGKFSLEKKRGLLTYSKLAAAGYFGFKTRKFKLRIDDVVMNREALMIVTANCSQFGNNAMIAPGAKADDGLLNISILKKAPIHRLPALTWQLFSGNLRNGPSVELYSGRKVQIEQESDYCQVDGEYFTCGRKLDISIDPLSLNIITPGEK